jgi:hypothetical protein
VSELVLKGPFLTRAQAARASGLPASLLPDRPDLLHIRSEFSQEAYFAFQFDDHGIRPDVARVVRVMREHADEITLADWLVRPNPELAGLSPLSYLNRRGAVDRVLRLDVESDSEVGDTSTLHVAPLADRSSSQQRTYAPQDSHMSQPEVLDQGHDDQPRRIRRRVVMPVHLVDH